MTRRIAGKVRLRGKLAAVVLAGCLGASCSSQVPGTSSSTVLQTNVPQDPSNPTPAAPGLTTPVSTNRPWVASGLVRIHNASGVSLARDENLYGWIERTTVSSPLELEGGVDSNGHYALSLEATALRIYVYSGEYQPCVTTVDPTHPDAGDVDIVRDVAQLGAHLPASLILRGPTLSGMVYEQGTTGRQPVANVAVRLTRPGGNYTVAYTRTDADGQYMFCGVSRPDFGLAASAEGFQPAGVGLTGNTRLDIELTRR